MGTVITPPNDLAAELALDLEDAFPAFVHQTIDGIYSGVRRLAPGEAEEITQQTYVRAWKALGGYEPERIRSLKLQGWLWTIALNLCRNAARSRSRRPQTVGLEAARPMPSTLPSPEAVAMQSAEAAEWDRRFRLLAEPLRNGVVLRHVVGLSYVEMADALNRPVGTVKADVHRGLEHLRRIINDEGEEHRA
jgi:RNA polymerase sigma-70 factor (ECF subfamily)